MASTPLRPGDAAPHFALPAVNREGQVSLDDYRGRSPVLVALFRGLHCPFCRRQLVQLGTTQDKLKAIGVETMAVVNTPLERARLYFKYRPARVLLAADPEAATHRSFGVPAGRGRRERIGGLVGPGDAHDGPAARRCRSIPPESCPSRRIPSRRWRP